jgi:hypothetical protein
MRREHDVGRPQFLSCRDAGASQGNHDGVDANPALSPVVTAATAHQECTLLPILRILSAAICNCVESSAPVTSRHATNEGFGPHLPSMPG